MKKVAILVKNIFAFGLNHGISKMLGLVLLPLYTRYLTPADYGMVELFNTWSSFLIPIVALGLPEAGFRFFWDGQDKDWHKRLTCTALVIYAATGVVLLLLTAIGDVFNWVENLPGQFYLQKINILTIVFLYAWIIAVGTFIQNIIRARNQLLWFILVSNAGALAGGLAGLYFVMVCGLGYAGIIWGSVGGCAFSALLSLLAIKELLPLKKFRRPDWGLAKKLLLFGLPLVPNGMGWTAIMFSDRLLLGWMAGADAVGLYGVAMRFASILFLWNQVFYLAWQYVVLSGLQEENKKGFYSQMLLAYTMVTAFLIICMTTFIPFIYPVLIGTAFAGGAAVVPVLASSAIFQGISSFLGINYIISKKSEKAMWTTLLGVGFNIIFCLLLIPGLNINGAAWGMLAAFAVMTIVRLKDAGLSGFNLAASRLTWAALLIAVLCPFAAIWSFKYWLVGIVALFSIFIAFLGLLYVTGTAAGTLCRLKILMKSGHTTGE